MKCCICVTMALGVGVFNFLCSMHPNAMFGQILVLPPKSP